MQNGDLTGLSVLIVEDEPLLRRQIAAEVERLGGDATAVGSLGDAQRAADGLSYDFVILDVHLPDGCSMNWLREGRLTRSSGVIVVTAHGDVAGAVEALRLGALDYLVKPFDPTQVLLSLGRAKHQKQNARIEEHRRGGESRIVSGFFFGECLAPVQRKLEKILAADQRVALKLPPVLIQGETGTGKTAIARWLHHHGPRANAPLVEVNCSALPDALAESELFGHERGAFTDARAARMGLFEAANGGTLFLDELPTLSPSLQAKVLKALEDHRIRRLGGTLEIPVDVRIIAAGPPNLAELVSEGRFRQDLYHRLDLYRLELPPIRERKADLIPLSHQLLEQICRKHQLPLKQISESGVRRILGAGWPGNVRELAHELERAVVFEEGDALRMDHLPGDRASEVATPSVLSEQEWLNPAFVYPSEGFSLDDAINRMIQKALDQTKGNVSAAARLLGVSRDYLRYRLSGDRSTGETER
ncbi:MAG: sigma-54-dependent Fis family transcriptional regulator [Verrucomicrobia bacterium]|nr:sigma-54-dependent Fis family transcriptional regulator [Verrucomicrobiota bacterium]